MTTVSNGLNQTYSIGADGIEDSLRAIVPGVIFVIRVMTCARVPPYRSERPGVGLCLGTTS